MKVKKVIIKLPLPSFRFLGSIPFYFGLFIPRRRLTGQRTYDPPVEERPTLYITPSFATPFSYTKPYLSYFLGFGRNAFLYYKKKMKKGEGSYENSLPSPSTPLSLFPSEKG